MAKTTVILREDIYKVLKKKYGARQISKAINEKLAEALLLTSDEHFLNLEETIYIG